MSSSSTSDDDGGDVCSHSDSSRSRSEDSLVDSDSDAIVISTRSQIVISPRRRVSAATWDSLERQLGGADRSLTDAAEHFLGGVDALRRAQSTAKRSESPARIATKSSDSRARTSAAPRNSSSRSRGAAKREPSPSTKSRRTDSSRKAQVSSSTPALDPSLVESAAEAGRTTSTSSTSRHRVAATTRSRSHRHRERHKSRSSDSSDGDGDDGINNAPRSRRDTVRPPPAPQSTRDELLGSSSEEEEEIKQDDNESESDAEPAHRAKSSRARRAQHQQQRQHNEQSTASSAVPLRKRETHHRTASSRSISKAKTKTSMSAKTTAKDAVNERSTRRRREAAPSSSSDASSVESPRSRPSAKSKKHTSFLSEQSVDDAAAVAVLPSPKEEMEELKQTLKNLASHDNRDSSSSIGGSGNATMPGGDSGLPSHRPSEYLRVATAALASPSAADQLRLGEYVSQQPFGNGEVNAANAKSGSTAKRQSSTSASRHASFDPATLDSKLREAREAPNHNRSQSLSMAANGTLFGEPPPRTSSLSQKLFGQNPTAAGVATGTATGTSGLFMPTSSPYSANGTSGLLGIGSSAITSAAAVAAAGGAQGSRAVLSALKALQDKIRRLEEEREMLTQQLSDERVKSRKREAELASSEKKFSYELGQTKESARAAYDAVRAEREELKVELVKTDERRKSAETEIQHFQALMQTYASKSDDLQTQLEISESQRTRLQSELEHVTSSSKREAQELIVKVQTLEQQQAARQEQLDHLSAQFERETNNHAETRARLHDAEQTVASVSELNEKLVARVWEVTEVANKATKQSRKLQQQQRVSTVSKSTAASRASAAAAAAAASGATSRSSTASSSLASRRAGSALGFAPGSRTSGSASRMNGSDTGASATARGGLKKKASSASAADGTATSSSSSAMKKTTRKAKARESTGTGATNLALLRDANLGKDVPFLLGTSSSPSFSLIGNVQDALRQCASTYVTPNTLTAAPIRIPTATARGNSSGGGKSPSHLQRTPRAHPKAAKSSGVSAAILGVAPPPPPPVPATVSRTLVSDRTRSAVKATKRALPPSAIEVPPLPPAPVSAHINPMQTQILDDLATALHSAETEFATLNSRYKDTVARMKADGTDPSSSDSSRSTDLASALGPLLDELEAKGKQVNLLQQVYQQASQSSINPLRRAVHSPEAIQRKTASLRLLNEYRQLERTARVSPHKRSAATATPSSSVFFGDHAQY